MDVDGAWDGSHMRGDSRLDSRSRHGECSFVEDDVKYWDELLRVSRMTGAGGSQVYIGAWERDVVNGCAAE